MPSRRSRDARARAAVSDARLAGRLMRGQALLGLGVAAIFLPLLLGLPLLTHLRPDWARTPVLGFPLSWFLLGILFYPITWALSLYFVRASERLEAEEARLVREERGEA